MRFHVVIPAGGKGVRSGFNIPKQYVKISGKELIAYTIDVFQKNKKVNDITIAAAKGYFEILNKIVKKYNFNKVTNIIEGGSERQDSVFNALTSLIISNDDFVIVHDAARPLISQKILNQSIEDAIKFGNSVVCIKAKDTLLKGNEKVEKYVDRKDMFYVQTPQIFRYSDLMKAMNKAKKQNFYGTDESMLIKKYIGVVHITEGSSSNFKITSKEDIELFKKIVA
ncbi:MAG TPA: 2-C-methyl-D-erythritol 4-phosphate cytidylyltransferase [Ignavibacteriaceae bacterium]|nr:2-C-methyl-D-erythritol 4-phosphate cytidylyltransferase [Ignavibacteriaceae bacterium]